MNEDLVADVISLTDNLLAEDKKASAAKKDEKSKVEIKTTSWKGEGTETPSESKKGKSPEMPTDKAKKNVSGSPATGEKKTEATVDLLASQLVSVKNLSAYMIERALKEVYPDCQFKYMGEKLLLIREGQDCPVKIEALKDFVAKLDESAKPTKDDSTKSEKGGDSQGQTRAQGLLVRLFHLRDAKAVADAFKIGDEAPVKPIGSNVVLIDPKDGKLDTIKSIERILAKLDLPRPQIGLQMWSLQISTEDPIKTDQQLRAFRGKVSEFNNALQESLRHGWNELMRSFTKAQTDQSVTPHNDFQRYIEKDYLHCSLLDRYCLGYQDAFLESTPSLTRMLLFLAALPDPSKELSWIIRAMRGAGWREWSANWNRWVVVGDKIANKPMPRFENLEKQLNLLFDDKNTQLFRAAVLDFLFHYKWAKAYPQQFIAYDLSVSAHALDSLLTPIHDAFALDLGIFVESLENERSYRDLISTSLRRTHGWLVPNRFGHEVFSSNGLTRITTLSGAQATSTGKSANFFDVTAPISLNELLKENDLITKGLPDVLKTKESTLAGIAANLLTRPKVIAEVGRGITLTITPTALETAASAELQVDLKGGDVTAPAVVSGPSDKKLTIDRLSQHDVTDTVRVESQKLFEISTFGMQVDYRKDYVVPVIGDTWQAIFGGVPILNGLFRVEGGTLETVSHRSVVIVSAMVAPTAIDLAYSIRFDSDRELIPDGAKGIDSVGALVGDARAYHKLKMRCMRGSRESNCKDNGVNLTLSDVIGEPRQRP